MRSYKLYTVVVHHLHSLSSQVLLYTHEESEALGLHDKLKFFISKTGLRDTLSVELLIEEERELR